MKRSNTMKRIAGTACLFYLLFLSLIVVLIK